MRTMKLFLEKTTLIWFLVCGLYVAAFSELSWQQGVTDAESPVLETMAPFVSADFPPRIGNILEFKEFAGVGYYAIAGSVFHLLKSNLPKFRIVHLVVFLLALGLFVKLGRHFTYRNRLNPLWVSLGLGIFALNPYSWQAAFWIGPWGFFLLLMFLGLYCYEKDFYGWACVFVSIAALVHWIGILLPLAFVVTKVTEERAKVLDAARIFYFIVPFVVAVLPFFAWKGIYPPELSQNLSQYKEQAGIFRFDHFTYALALLPLYTLWFTWSWAFRSRTRALTISGIAAGVSILFFFIKPIQNDVWHFVVTGQTQAVGLVDLGAALVAGEYKNFLLCVPYLAGVFFFFLLLTMDVLDRSRVLRFFIVFFFILQLFLPSAGDGVFLVVVPFILLFSLAEALVGEEGNLTRI